MEPNAPPDSAVGGLRVKISTGSVCRHTKRRAVHKNLGIKDIPLMCHPGIKYSMKKETVVTLRTKQPSLPFH